MCIKVILFSTLNASCCEKSGPTGNFIQVQGKVAPQVKNVLIKQFKIPSKQIDVKKWAILGFSLCFIHKLMRKYNIEGVRFPIIYLLYKCIASPLVALLSWFA